MARISQNNIMLWSS